MKNVHAKNNVFCQTGMVEWNFVTRCIVVLNRSDYIRNMMELISDKKKNVKLTHDLTIKREQALQSTWNKRIIFSESEYFDIYPKGSRIAKLYSTPKIHKSFTPGSIPPIVFL